MNNIQFCNYKIGSHFCRSKYRHGGVLILTKSHIQTEEIAEIKTLSVERDIELAAVNIKPQHGVVISVYRSPLGDFATFLEILERALECLLQKFEQRIIYIAGDFNVNFLQKSSSVTQLLNLFNSYGLNIVFQEPSRIYQSSSSCIDNIVTNTDISSCSFKTINLHISDHMAQVLLDPTQTLRKQNYYKYISSRDINLTNTNLFIEMFNLKFTESTFDNMTAELAFNHFHTHFLKILNSAYPIKQKKINTSALKKQPFFSNDCLAMKNTLDAWATVAQVIKSSEAYNAYGTLKQQYLQKLSNERKKNNAQFIRLAEDKSKAMWTVIKKETNKNTKRNNEKNNITAEKFNNFFTDIAEDTLSKINNAPKYDNSSKLLTKKHINNCSSLYLNFTDAHEVFRIINNLKTKNTVDLYGLSTKTLKHIAPYISHILAVLFNKCIEEGYFPKELKISKIIPIYKKGDKEECNNFRPISLLPTISKVFELIIKDRLINFFERKDFLSSKQHGYRKDKSTFTAINEIIQLILKAHDSAEKTSIICCDLSKAFDTVNHKILLKKLEYYGVRGNAQNLMSSYLIGRRQCVEWMEEISTTKIVKHGVPQGSILGPILFIIYINDFIENIPAYGTCVYADDTSFLVNTNTFEQLEGAITNILSKAKAWMSSNQLLLNESKTQTMPFFQINEKKNIKFLGIYLDNKLNWNVHIEEISKKLSSVIHCIRSLNIHANKEAAKSCYYAYFYSYISYGIIFWGTSSEAITLFLLQKKAIRALCNLKQMDSCKNYFIKEKLLTLPCLYILNCLKYVHQNAYQLQLCSDLHSYNTRQKDLISISRHRLKVTQQGVDYWGIKLYNTLPTIMKQQNYAKFQRSVKNILLANAFYSVQDFLNYEF